MPRVSYASDGSARPDRCGSGLRADSLGDIDVREDPSSLQASTHVKSMSCRGNADAKAI